MNWGLGYNVDVGYTFGYYREQDPLWLDLCALVHGVRPPSLTSEKGLRYLELGCGQGLNLWLLAACRPEIEFVGVDFNPLHIAHAKHLSSAAGLTNVRFIEANFVDLAANWPEELGRFHYVSAHGVLSWISRSVRESLYGCLDNALFPGGLVYFSYNALPGWLSGLPIQHLMRLWQVREALTSLTAINFLPISSASWEQRLLQTGTLWQCCQRTQSASSPRTVTLRNVRSCSMFLLTNPSAGISGPEVRHQFGQRSREMLFFRDALRSSPGRLQEKEKILTNSRRVPEK